MHNMKSKKKLKENKLSKSHKQPNYKIERRKQSPIRIHLQEILLNEVNIIRKKTLLNFKNRTEHAKDKEVEKECLKRTTFSMRSQLRKKSNPSKHTDVQATIHASVQQCFYFSLWRAL